MRGLDDLEPAGWHSSLLFTTDVYDAAVTVHFDDSSEEARNVDFQPLQSSNPEQTSASPVVRLTRRERVRAGDDFSNECARFTAWLGELLTAPISQLLLDALRLGQPLRPRRGEQCASKPLEVLRRAGLLLRFLLLLPFVFGLGWLGASVTQLSSQSIDLFQECCYVCWQAAIASRLCWLTHPPRSLLARQSIISIIILAPRICRSPRREAASCSQALRLIRWRRL